MIKTLILIYHSYFCIINYITGDCNLKNVFSFHIYVNIDLNLYVIHHYDDMIKLKIIVFGIKLLSCIIFVFSGGGSTYTYFRVNLLFEFIVFALDAVRISIIILYIFLISRCHLLSSQCSHVFINAPLQYIVGNFP